MHKHICKCGRSVDGKTLNKESNTWDMSEREKKTLKQNENLNCEFTFSRKYIHCQTNGKQITKIRYICFLLLLLLLFFLFFIFIHYFCSLFIFSIHVFVCSAVFITHFARSFQIRQQYNNNIHKHNWTEE